MTAATVFFALLFYATTLLGVAGLIWRIRDYVRTPAPLKIPILNILGQTEPMDSPGYAVFRLHGHESETLLAHIAERGFELTQQANPVAE